MGYGELALKEETDGMAEINLWDLIVVKLSELGILKRYYRGISLLDSTRQVYNLGNGGVPVHQDPVHGIVPNHGK